MVKNHGLNLSQQQAVETTDGALLVLAGAGTGKTRVLIHRLAHILEKRLAMPWECLCLTFTNKASNEMRVRLENLVGANANQVWLGTFHRIGLKLIYPHLEALGLKKPFSIFDESDQKLLLKKIMIEMKVDLKVHAPSVAVEKISRLKDKGLLPENLRSQTKSGITIDDDFADGRLKKIYEQYQKRLVEFNAVDFGDLIIYPILLMKKYPEIKKRIQKKFKYILVDEYQDTNTAQYQLLKLLAENTGNLCVVGDDDQSIYAWRGADIRNILDFQKDFLDAKIVRLEENYRSTPSILNTAAHLISKNTERLGKTLRSGLEIKECEPVKIHSFFDAEEEARFITKTILTQKEKGISFSEMAILIRSAYLSRLIEEQLIEDEIPYQTVGTIKFYERAEIKDAIAYFRLVCQAQDDLAFERIINTPRRGVGKVALATIQKTARLHNKPLLDGLNIAVDFGEIRGKTADVLKEFLTKVQIWRKNKETLSAPELGEKILEESGYLGYWQNSKEADAEMRLDHIKDLLGTLKKFATLEEFLEHISLVSASDSFKDNDQILLMTMHASKGLEFEIVFLPAWEEGIFPNEKAIEEDKIQEERRLAYVGITRAKKHAMISYCTSRFLFGSRQNNFPSCFVQELPKETTKLVDHSYTPKTKKTKQTRAKKITQDLSFSMDLNSLLIGKKVLHKEFGKGEILEADATELTVLFSNERVEKVHARKVSFL